MILLQTPRPDLRRDYDGNHESMDLGIAESGMNTAFVMLDYSQDFPRKEWPGGKNKESRTMSV